MRVGTKCCLWMFILVSMVGALSSCCKKENLTKVFVEQMQIHGGKLGNTNGLPTINTCWTLQTDSDGFQLKIRNVTFGSIENMVTNALGVAGELRDQTTGATARYRLFKASSIGIGLLMRETKDGVQLNCINKGF